MANNEKNKMSFKDIAAINVNEHVDKKTSGSKELTYLSWPWAVAKASEIDPEWSYKILEFDVNGMPVDRGLPYQKVAGGYFVQTEVTLLGQTKRMWLPVMESHNNAMKDHAYQVQTKYSTYTVTPIDAMAINKTIMRCLVKNLGMFGLGLYIYAGEDLPEDNGVVIEPENVNPQTGEVVSDNPEPVSVKAEDIKDVSMTYEEALVHCFEQGGEALKGVPVLKLVTNSTNPEKSTAMLKGFAEKGTGKDKIACQLILEALENGVLSFPQNQNKEEAVA